MYDIILVNKQTNKQTNKKAKSKKKNKKQTTSTARAMLSIFILAKPLILDLIRIALY